MSRSGFRKKYDKRDKLLALGDGRKLMMIRFSDISDMISLVRSEGEA